MRPRRACDRAAGGQKLRTFGVGAQILKDLGVCRMRVLSAPKQMHGISAFGLEIDGLRGRRVMSEARSFRVSCRRRSGGWRVIASRFNEFVVSGLVEGAPLRAWEKHGGNAVGSRRARACPVRLSCLSWLGSLRERAVSRRSLRSAA